MNTNNTQPIATAKPDSLSIRGVPIETLIYDWDFFGAIALLIGKEEWMDEGKGRMLNALLVAWVDHGELPPSTQNVRNAASVGVPFLQAAMAGFACFGFDHGPIEKAADFLKDKWFHAHWYIDSGRIIPGFGHPLHKNDPRVSALRSVAVDTGVAGEHFNRLLDVERVFDGRGKNVHPNLAGISAALWLDMGFSVETVGLLPLLGRSIGFAAHYEEQARNPKKFKGTP